MSKQNFNKGELLILRQFVKDDLRRAEAGGGANYTLPRLTNLYSLKDKIANAIRSKK